MAVITIDVETVRRIRAHLAKIQQQLRVNEAYARDAGCGDVVEIGNGHVRDDISDIYRELTGERTYVDAQYFDDSPLFVAPPK